jgi:hypothetical protein
MLERFINLCSQDTYVMSIGPETPPIPIDASHFSLDKALRCNLQLQM